MTRLGTQIVNLIEAGVHNDPEIAAILSCDRSSVSRIRRKLKPKAAVAKRGRGRPTKRAAGERVFGMTLRVPSEVRKQLRRKADDETDRRGRVVSIHDVIMEALTTLLANGTRQ